MTSARDRRRRGLVAFASAWMLLIPALTFASPLLAASGRRAVPTATRLVCSTICHQRPERTWRIAGELMPLCARCAGLAAGFGLGVLIAAVALSWRRGAAAANWLQGRADDPRRLGGPLNPSRVLILLTVTTAPLAIDGSAQWLQLYPSPAEFRTFTGVLCGAALSFVTLAGLALEGRARVDRPGEDSRRLSADSTGADRGPARDTHESSPSESPED